jgi:hypothetical protein
MKGEGESTSRRLASTRSERGVGGAWDFARASVLAAKGLVGDVCGDAEMSRGGNENMKKSGDADG